MCEQMPGFRARAAGGTELLDAEAARGLVVRGHVGVCPKLASFHRVLTHTISFCPHPNPR